MIPFRLVPWLVAAAALWAQAPSPFASRLAALEARSGGRLGVAVLDTATGVRMSHRGEERFALCSTFKMLLAAAVLSRVDAGQERLDRRIPVRPRDLVDHSPVTKGHQGRDLDVESLCRATVSVSDNTAANLLLRTLGGPKGFTRFARSIGDRTTRLDRYELELNSNLPGDPRDTTTPSAMVATMEKVLLGQVLSEASRKRLEGWMTETATGAARLKAGLPEGWTIAHKTGTGERGATNDIALLRHPGRAPILVTAYYSESAAASQREAVLAEVARIVVDAAR